MSLQPLFKLVRGCQPQAGDLRHHPGLVPRRFRRQPGGTAQQVLRTGHGRLVVQQALHPSRPGRGAIVKIALLAIGGA